MILRHVLKIGAIVVVLIFILWAFGPLIYYRIATINDAEDLADSVGFNYKLYRNPQEALKEGADKLKLMGYSDEEISQCVIEFLPIGAREKTSVRVTVVKIASNSIINYFGALKKYAKISTTKEVSIAAAKQS